MFELDAYLRRIGLAEREQPPSLAELHTAHVTAIPFEGFDAHMGVTPLLTPDALAEKLVEGGRGGYCFEQNLLLKAALEELGYEVDTFLARVMLGGVERPTTHLVLRVRGGEGAPADAAGPAGAGWLADVGFGSGTLLEPLPWGPGEAHEQGGWCFRVLERGLQHVLQCFEESEWRDRCGFIPAPVPQADIEMSNWYVSTHPASAFVTGMLASRQWADGRRLILSDWGELTLIERTAERSSSTPVAREQIPALLEERFELAGFTLDADGRVRSATVRV